jgi:hypothetical protein
MQQNFCDFDIWIGTKEFAQNAGNRISEVLDFKYKQFRSERRKSHFRGPRFQRGTPLQMQDFMYASVSSGAGSAPDYYNSYIKQLLNVWYLAMI